MKYLLILALFGLSLRLALAQDSVPDLNAKKAQTIYNLSKFIEWPKHALSGDNFVLCLLGSVDDVFLEHLQKVAERKHIHGKPSQFRRVELEAAKQCHVALIGLDQAAQLSDILNSLGQLPILTVSELEGFAENGGIIGLGQSDEQRVRFHINLDSALAAQLSVRSQVLVMSLLIGKQNR
jgi:hypothetical protein